MSHGADGKFDGGAGSGRAAPPQKMKEDGPFRANATIQRYCEEHNEAHLARELNGRSLPDNEPVDIILHGADGNIIRGIELKTMVRNVRGQIRVKGSARERKQNWEAEHKIGVDLVIFDDRLVYNANGVGKHDDTKRRIYYRRGYGNFNVNSMHEVADIAELKRVINAEESELPIAAQRKN